MRWTCYYVRFQVPNVILINAFDCARIRAQVFRLPVDCSNHWRKISNSLNLNFTNFLHHKRDFGITAEWHFHATANGKGPCNGISANWATGCNNRSSARKPVKTIEHVVTSRVKTGIPKSHKYKIKYYRTPKMKSSLYWKFLCKFHTFDNKK